MKRLIDADALTDELIKGIEADTDRSIQTSFTKSVCMILCKAIEQQPTIDAEPVRHGKWIYGNEFHWYTASCNRCGYKRTTDIKAANWNAWKYCPNCGARMDKE